MKRNALPLGLLLCLSAPASAAQPLPPGPSPQELTYRELLQEANDRIAGMGARIAEQARQIEELKKKVPPEPKAPPAKE